MAAVIDTMVLVYAFFASHPPTSKTQAKRHADMAKEYEASRGLVSRLPAIRVSAVSVVEFMRGIKDADQAEWFEKRLKRMQVLPVDVRVSLKAAELLRKRQAFGRTCARCLSAEQDSKCPKCGRNVSSHQRLNDAVIAATAELDGDTQVLWTFDKGMSAFQPFMSQCLIRSPLDTLDEATTRHPQQRNSDSKAWTQEPLAFPKRHDQERTSDGGRTIRDAVLPEAADVADHPGPNNSDKR